MLQKGRDTRACLPDGLMKVAQDTVKGRAVVRKLVDGEFKLVLPSTAEEAKNFYGFVTLDIEFKEHKGSYYDVIKEGTRAVCYTRVKDNEWKTTEFVGELVVGDKCAVAFEGENAGKVVKSESDATMEVVGLVGAMAGYEYPMVIVKLI